MLKKLILGAAALTATGTALPAAAEAHGYRDSGRYERGYAYRDGYRDRYYNSRSYDRGYRSYGYDDRRYDDGRYYGRRRCGSGTTGAIIGGAAGALLGREIGRGGRDRYGYRRGGSGTTGAIIGGAAGALLGGEVGRSC